MDREEKGSRRARNREKEKEEADISHSGSDTVVHQEVINDEAPAVNCVGQRPSGFPEPERLLDGMASRKTSLLL